MTKFFKIILILSVFAFSSAYYYWTTTPTYSLNQLKNAFQNHDREGVEKYLDVETLVSSALDQFVAIESDKTKSKNEWENAGRNLAKGFFNLLKPQIAAAAKQELMKYVETGEICKNTSKNNSLKMADSLKETLASGIILDRITSVTKQGKIAHVDISLLNSKGQRILPTLKMREKGGYWQVFEVSNIAQVIAQNDTK